MNTELLNDEDAAMAEYILKILKLRKITMMSWGFHKPTVIKDGLLFSVNGFKHTGTVKIIYQHGLDLFQIKLINEKGELVHEFCEIYFDQLTDLIDEDVEMFSNYEERVRLAYTKEDLYSNDDCIQNNL